MGDAAQNRARAATLPHGDVIRVLLEQHAQIRDLFTTTITTTGQDKKESFDALRALLAVHETAEEMVLRPVTAGIVGETVTEARNAEEKEANEFLAELEMLDVNDPDFDARLKAFEKTVDEHADAEEKEEFEPIIAACDAEKRQKMGTKVRAAEAAAPTHPHPSVEPGSTRQRVVGPFAALVDRAKDAISKAG